MDQVVLFRPLECDDVGFANDTERHQNEYCERRHQVRSLLGDRYVYL